MTRPPESHSRMRWPQRSRPILESKTNPGRSPIICARFHQHSDCSPQSTDTNAVRATSGSGVFDTYANVMFVNTHPDWRHRGIGRAMTAAALRAARDSGATQACLDATAEGKAIYASLGFEAAAEATRFYRPHTASRRGGANGPPRSAAEVLSVSGGQPGGASGPGRSDFKRTRRRVSAVGRGGILRGVWDSYGEARSRRGPAPTRLMASGRGPVELILRYGRTLRQRASRVRECCRTEARPESGRDQTHVRNGCPGSPVGGALRSKGAGDRGLSLREVADRGGGVTPPRDHERAFGSPWP